MGYKSIEMQREYQRNWLAKRREAFFQDKQCAECGCGDNLELDHIDPTTKVSARIWSWSAERQAVEIAKCQVLCEPCHQTKSIAQMPITNGRFPYSHGTRSMYERHKCRCEPCREWKREKNARCRGNALVAHVG